MRKSLSVIVFAGLTFAACDTSPKLTRVDGPLQYVDTYIGTSGHGHTFMGAAAPFGMIQLGPSNINKGWDWCSAYHYSDSIVIGFAHLHLNGTGCSDTGDLVFMPYTGPEQVFMGTQEDPDSGYASRYSHDTETALPGYYSVMLDDYDVKVELTASERTGFHRYTFPKDSEKRLLINLKHANGDDRALETYIRRIDDYTIGGYRVSTGWAKGEQHVYFTAVFSQPVELKIFNEGEHVDQNSCMGTGVMGSLTFPEDAPEVLVKVGVSPVSSENGLENMEAEIPHWDFAQVVKETHAKWNTELSKVIVKSNDTSSKRIFYTAMYHAFLQPNIYSDMNGDCRLDKYIFRDMPFVSHTVFSLWDTYRTAHPLYTILQPDKVSDFINTFIMIYYVQGILPVWHLYGSDTWEMIGIQSVPVIADAIAKGVEGFDYMEAYEAMKGSMLSDYKGLNFLREGDYIPSDLEGESVAKGLEYAIADWGVAQTAKILGYDEDYEYFSRRAKNYAQYWDHETAFFRGKNADGTWREPFNPVSSSHRSDDYCEGTGWQYIWLVPHDVAGLVSLFGSEVAFNAKLDELFTLEADMGADASGDISGLIGQYAHGNEPGHQTVYLYAFTGQQWKTAARVREVLDTMYSDQPDGLDGNEDCGQMSSWYIMSSLGFYPVNPSNGIYVLGSPRFDVAEISLHGGKTFTVKAPGNSDKNIYIQEAKLNGQPYTKSYIRHHDIMNGGTLELVMGPEPNYSFGTAPEDRPKDFMH